MRRILSTAAVAVAMTALWAGGALANCTNNPPDADDVMVCTGTTTTAIDDGSPRVTVEVQPGATLATSGDAIKLRDNDTKVFNEGTISGGDEAIVAGNRLRVENGGLIEADDHAIVGETETEVDVEGEDVRLISTDMFILNKSGATIDAGGDAVQGGNRLTVENHGTMTAGDDLINAEQVVIDAGGNFIAGADDVTVKNWGTMTATDKGITVDNGKRFKLTNHTGATIVSEEGEGVEAGDDAEVTNQAGASITGFDDAVQVGERAVIVNHGLIENTQVPADIVGDVEAQDAIDIDSGSIVNGVTGIIRSTTNAAIDYDESVEAVSTIDNAGLISGTIAVETDPANVKAQEITNAGSMVGTSGLALNLGGGDDLYRQLAGGSITGGGAFGSGDDRMILDGFLAGFVGGGALFDGGADEDTFSVTNYLFSELQVTKIGGEYDLAFDNGTSAFSVRIANWENFVFGGARYSLADLDLAAQVPLPATLPLLLAAFGGIGLAARRRRA